MEVFVPLVAPHLFAILSGTLLTGVIFSEVATFFTHEDVNFPRRRVDVWVVRVVVLLSMALLALDWWGIYDITVTHAADLNYPFLFHIQQFPEPFLASLLGGVCQLWFAERAWKLLGRSSIFLVVVVVLTLLSIGAAFSNLIIWILSDGTPESWEKENRCTMIWLLSSFTEDLLITTVLCWKVRDLFHAAGKFSGRARSLAHIVRLSFATGSLTSTSALIAAAVYLKSWRTTNDWLVPALLLPRFSALSCVITMNIRARWRATVGGAVGAADLGLASTLYSPRDHEEENLPGFKNVQTVTMSSSLKGLDSRRGSGKAIEMGEEKDFEPESLSYLANGAERAVFYYNRTVVAHGLSPVLEDAVFERASSSTAKY